MFKIIWYNYVVCFDYFTQQSTYSVKAVEAIRDGIDLTASNPGDVTLTWIAITFKS